MMRTHLKKEDDEDWGSPGKQKAQAGREPGHAKLEWEQAQRLRRASLPQPQVRWSVPYVLSEHLLATLLALSCDCPGVGCPCAFISIPRICSSTSHGCPQRYTFGISEVGSR
jgi:hypothetical protein